MVSLKRRAFTRVLDAEAPHLSESAALIAALRQRVAEMGTASGPPAAHAPAPAFGPDRVVATG